MGLDMYLEAEIYVGGWDHKDQNEKTRYARLLEEAGLTQFACDQSPSVRVCATVAYWRKANAIHKWFVDNCQEGRDECQRTYISHEKLAELVSLCKQVLNSVETVEGDVCVGTRYSGDGEVKRLTTHGNVVAQTQIAKNMLPTKQGFFFGSTDYDQYYLDDIRQTIEQIEPLLNEDFQKKYSVYYHSSW